MKPADAGQESLSISFYTRSRDDASLAAKALCHAYPGSKVTARLPDGSAGDDPANLIIIDSRAATEAQLDHILESAPETPAVIIVGDLTEVRRFGRHLTGRRALATRADIGGIGLIQSVHHLLDRQRLRDQLRKASAHLKELSIRDDLTKLFNHRHFNELLALEVRKANRYKRPLALVIFTIKNFTAINEAFGHALGDRVLVRAAEMIRGAVRDVDIPTRYGDNEFAVILPESDEAAARIVAGRISESLAKIELPGDGENSRVAVSSGIGALAPGIQTRDDLLRTALGALIEAKRNGAGSICSSGEAESRRRSVRENRQLIEQMGERLARLAGEAHASYFKSLVRAVGDIPVMKQQVLPHSERVAFYAERLAERVGMDRQLARAIYRAGVLHDLGKLAIDPEILAKPARLTEPEERLMRGHPLFAAQMIGRTPLATAELEAIIHHHERHDERIPRPARVLAIAEAWDAMISPQPYRAEPLTLDRALSEMRDGAGTQFDPVLVLKFTGLISG
jgi:diguanylate cyclase (GGDEF)-like protein/putative nucleotidyltransferase with HDIG domain